MTNKIKTFFARVGDKLAQNFAVKNNIKAVVQINNINVLNTVLMNPTDKKL